jgi:hypothetical protein
MAFLKSFEAVLFSDKMKYTGCTLIRTYPFPYDVPLSVRCTLIRTIFGRDENDRSHMTDLI